MSNFTTPMIDYKKLPPTISEWVSRRLIQEEKIRLAVQGDSDTSVGQFYFLTTQKLIFLAAEHQPSQAYIPRSHEIYFIENIYGIRVTAKSEAYGTGVDSYEVTFRYGGNDSPSIRLDPQAAEKFESSLLALLYDLKDAWE